MNLTRTRLTKVTLDRSDDAGGAKAVAAADDRLRGVRRVLANPPVQRGGRDGGLLAR